MNEVVPPIELPPDTPAGPTPEAKFYCLFTAEGAVRGFWTTDIYPPAMDGSINPAIPPEAIEITRAQWDELIKFQATARFVNGEVTYPLSAQPLGSAEYNWGAPLIDVVGRN